MGTLIFSIIKFCFHIFEIFDLTQQKMNKFLSDLTDNLDNARTEGFAIDVEGTLKFKEYFEKTSYELLATSATMQSTHSSEMDDALKTLKAKFKESCFKQDELLIQLMTNHGNMKKIDENLKDRADKFIAMTADIASLNKVPTSLQMCYLEFLLLLKKIEAWIDELEAVLPFTAKSNTTETLQFLKDMDSSKRKETAEDISPKLLKLESELCLLMWLVRGMDDQIVRLFNSNMVKTIDASEETRSDVATMVFASTVKVLPTLNRLMACDTNIENFLKKIPRSEVKTDCGKLDMWLLDDIDTRMTCLETELLIGISFLVQSFLAKL